MPDQIKSTVKLFADDTKIYNSTNSEKEYYLQADINTLQSWSKKWQLQFNASKCKAMCIGEPNINHTLSMDTRDGSRINLEATAIEKDLGIHIDNRLSFKHHVSAVVSKANKISDVIKRSFTHMDEFLFKKLHPSG